tara:strand:- start:455 stop:637 length:183 start_codon:yes stop_codon:yes gene_type:complete
MTRKDYIKIAKVFNKLLRSEEYNGRDSDSMFWMLAIAMEEMLEIDNENFDASKFMEAIKK